MLEARERRRRAYLRRQSPHTLFRMIVGVLCLYADTGSDHIDDAIAAMGALERKGFRVELMSNLAVARADGPLVALGEMNLLGRPAQ